MNRPPRIVHVYKDVYPPVEGGIERIIAHLARLTVGPFEPRILVASRERHGHSRLLMPGVEVSEVPSLGRILSTPLAPGFVGALRRSGADLFHFHAPHPTGEVAYLLSGLRTPAVVTYHSDIVRQRLTGALYGPLLCRFLGRMSVIMPTSRRYLETSATLAPHRSRCRPVALGYPLEDYTLTPAIGQRAGQLRREWGEFVMFLGCLRRYKGLPFLIEAMANLWSAGKLPATRLVIAGEGPMAEPLRATASRLGLDGRIVFTGRVSQEEAVAVLHAAALFVLPSHQRSEAFGLCQIEAMACGLPVISTDLPTGVPEVNRDGVSGLVVPPGDPAALAKAIEELMANPERRAALGQGGLQRARALFTAERMAEEVMQVYREVLQASPGASL